jgi:hypothetical protein
MYKCCLKPSSTNYFKHLKLMHVWQINIPVIEYLTESAKSVREISLSRSSTYVSNGEKLTR